MPQVLFFGDRGPAVEDIQRRLNCRTPTRLPRLGPDRVYGVSTMARVMEFQFQKKLKIDGACGKNTHRELSTGPARCDNAIVPKGRCILVDLIRRRLSAFRDGARELHIRPIHGGSPADPSTRGVFQMSDRRLRHHTSSQFPDPPGNMDFSLFYHRGEAIHQGPPDEPSHGCIHVGAPDAQRVFNWADQHDILVIVVKLTP